MLRCNGTEHQGHHADGITDSSYCRANLYDSEQQIRVFSSLGTIPQNISIHNIIYYFCVKYCIIIVTEQNISTKVIV